MTRHDGRTPSQLRPVRIEPGYVKYPHGSALITFGDTRVLCTVMVEEKVPGFLESRSEPQGWLTCEYSLLPASGLTRNGRAGYGSNQVKGRVHEVQRLIGRALRAAIDLKKVGKRTILIDCDVIQADGGTRTASVTGAMVALELAVRRLMKEGKLTQNPLIARVAAVSVGLVAGEAVLDLDYKEDSSAETDLNLVLNRAGGYIEMQGTAEDGIFTRQQLDQMLKLGEDGVQKLFQLQDEALKV